MFAKSHIPLFLDPDTPASTRPLHHCAPAPCMQHRSAELGLRDPAQQPSPSSSPQLAPGCWVGWVRMPVPAAGGGSVEGTVQPLLSARCLRRLMKLGESLDP